jgi:hypothetical protein
LKYCQELSLMREIELLLNLYMMLFYSFIPKYWSNRYLYGLTI